MGERIRMSLELSAETHGLLKDLSARAGLTMSGLLRRGIALAEVVAEAAGRGERLVLTDREGKITARILTGFTVVRKEDGRG